MRPLNPTLLRDLAAHEAPLCVSLYMEVAAGGGEHGHVRTALKNAKSEAEEALAGAGAEAAAVTAVRERLEALDYDDVVGGHDRRVAVFVAPDRTVVVDARFDETSVHVGPRFRLAPLLAQLEQTPEHAVLVASSDSARLYRSKGGRLVEEAVENMPGSLAEISQYTDQQEKGNIHGREDSGIPASYRGGLSSPSGPAGPSGVPHHSMGGHDWREDHEQDMRSYANALINAAGHHLSGTNVPLVVVADERLHGMICAQSEYPFLLEEGITTHPHTLDETKLREAAAACLHRAVEQQRAEAWDKVAMSLGRNDHEASTDPADIVTAAAAGRVAHLFVRAGAKLRGRFDPRSLEVEVAESGPEDLADRAIVETLRNGGDVFPMEDRGDGAQMAAAYRYPA
jgi:hypothetical protein